MTAMSEKELLKIRGKRYQHDISGPHDLLKSAVHHWQSDRRSP